MDATDHRGVMIYGPVANAMEKLKANRGEPNLSVWMALHEVSHTFQQSEDALRDEGVLTGDTELQLIRNYAESFEKASENNRVYSHDPRIMIIMQRALAGYQRDDAEAVGRNIG